MLDHLGIEGAHTHSLRHQFASEALDANPRELANISQVLGHDSIETTLRFYIHASANAEQRIGAMMNARRTLSPNRRPPRRPADRPLHQDGKQRAAARNVARQDHEQSRAARPRKPPPAAPSGSAGPAPKRLRRPSGSATPPLDRTRPPGQLFATAVSLTGRTRPTRRADSQLLLLRLLRRSSSMLSY
jgi:hypothetical protein